MVVISPLKTTKLIHTAVRSFGVFIWEPGWPYPPSDVVVLHLHTGSLDIVPGLELPPLTWAALAFDATGRWLLTTVSEGERGELLAWRQGMPGPALVTTLPGPLVTAPPLLPRLSS